MRDSGARDFDPVDGALVSRDVARVARETEFVLVEDEPTRFTASHSEITLTLHPQRGRGLVLEQGGSSATAVASTYNLWAAELLLVARMTRVLAEPVSAGTVGLAQTVGAPMHRYLDSALDEISPAQADEFERMVAQRSYHPLTDG